MTDDMRKLEKRLAELEPKMAAAHTLAGEAANKRRKFLNPKRTEASMELCNDIKALAGEKGVVVEFTMWDIGDEGHMAACFCCCMCLA